MKQYLEDKVELYQNFFELERPKERFAFSYLPKHTEVLFREALSCYSNNSFNAFASMCRRSAKSAFRALGEGGKLRAFDDAMMAQDIAEIDDESFEPIKQVLFDTGDEETLPVLNRAQAGVLLNAKEYPGMLDTTSTLVYLERLVACDWLEADESEHLSAAYKEYRKQVNRKALLVEQTEKASAAMQGHREQVIGVWKRLMPVNKVN